jgi:hypothetical protein
VAAEHVLDQRGTLVEAAEAERAEVDVPLGVIDLDEANVLPAQGLADIHPVAPPADAAVITHAAHLVVAGVLEGREVARYGRGEAR